MKKHGIIIDMINNSLAFWLGHCIYISATSHTTLSQPRLPTKIAFVRIEKNIILQKIIKKGLKEDMTNFLKILNKLSSKKKRQINKSRQKTNIEETSLKKATISSLDSFDKKELLVSIPAIKKLDHKAKVIDIVMIGMDVYYVACCLKET